METIYFAGGCLWGVQHFIKSLPGVVETEAGRANGMTNTLEGDYDGYAECVKTVFDPRQVSVKELLGYFFEIIDPYSVDRQGNDVGKYLINIDVKIYKTLSKFGSVVFIDIYSKFC